MDEGNYPESDLTGKIIGIAIDVHKQLGPGFNEKIYHRILALKFRENKLPHGSEVKTDIYS